MPRVKFRDRGRPVGKQRSRFFTAAVGTLGLLGAIVTFYIGYQAAYSVPGRSYYNIKAEFEDANNLANHYEVWIGGVRAGQILHPRVENGKAVVDMRLNDKFRPLRSDSKLQVRLRSAVGVRYLEIIPGTKGAPLPEDATIKSSQVVDSVALDQVLGTFDANTRERTATLLRELGTGVGGRGTDLNDSIATAPRLLSGLRGVSTEITQRPGRAMSRFIRGGEATAAAFDDAREDLVEGFEPERRALAALDDAGDGVQGTLAEAPPSLRTLETTLPNVNRLVNETGTLAREARPTLAAAPASLTETTRLLDDAEQPLKNLRETLDLAEEAVEPTLDLLGKVRPLLPTLDRTMTTLTPTVDQLGPRACEISNAAIGWGHYLGIGSTETNFIRFQFLALRPEQPAGQTGKGSKELDALYDSFVNVDPYYGPCTNGGSEGATGKQRVVTARVINAGKRPFNRTDNQPYEPDPNKVSSPDQVIQGGK